MTFGNYNLQLSIQYILLPSVPIPVIRLLAMVHLQHDGPPVALLGLPKLLHHLGYQLILALAASILR